MSHTSKVSGIVFNDPVALEQTAKEFTEKFNIPCEIQKDVPSEKVGMYYHNQLKKDTGVAVAPYYLKIEGESYGVAFIKNENGDYVPRFDPHAGYLQQHLGHPGNVKVEDRDLAPIARFAQTYVKNAAIRKLKLQGFKVTNVVQKENGELNLVFAD